MLYPNYSLDQLEEVDNKRLFAVICLDCYAIQLVLKARTRDWIRFHRERTRCLASHIEKRELA